MFADPPTWIVACFKFRFSRLPAPVPRRIVSLPQDSPADDVTLPDHGDAHPIPTP